MKSIMIYGRCREKFQTLFPLAKFEGYECNIRFAYFSIKNKISKSKILESCGIHKIEVIEFK